MDNLSQSSELTHPSVIESLLNDEASAMECQVPDGRSRIARCIMTMWLPDRDPKWLDPTTYFETSHIQLWCGQFEECPDTERLHCHIYVEFTNRNRKRFDQLRSLIEEKTGKCGDVKVPRKSNQNQRACAVNYCLKPDSRFPDTEPFIWSGNKFAVGFNENLYINRGKSSNKKTERDEQVVHIMSKPESWTWDQIVHENDASRHLLAACSWGPKFHAGRMARHARRTIKNVIVFYGAGGTGKTTLALSYDKKPDEEDNSRYYRRNPDDGKFWGGGRTAYRGQRIIHFEEFCGQETAGTFKEVCDLGKPGPSVNVKNGGTELNHETVIITSNHHPCGWYRHLCSNDPKQWNPIARRFTQVLFFPELRPDGTRNIPDDEHPPYYQDQTEVFLDPTFQADYDTATNHASTWWPMTEASEANLVGQHSRSEFETYCTTGRNRNR